MSIDLKSGNKNFYTTKYDNKINMEFETILKAVDNYLDSLPISDLRFDNISLLKNETRTSIECTNIIIARYQHSIYIKFYDICVDIMEHVDIVQEMITKYYQKRLRHEKHKIILLSLLKNKDKLLDKLFNIIVCPELCSKYRGLINNATKHKEIYGGSSVPTEYFDPTEYFEETNLYFKHNDIEIHNNVLTIGDLTTDIDVKLLTKLKSKIYFYIITYKT